MLQNHHFHQLISTPNHWVTCSRIWYFHVVSRNHRTKKHIMWFLDMLCGCTKLLQVHHPFLVTPPVTHQGLPPWSASTGAPFGAVPRSGSRHFTIWSFPEMGVPPVLIHFGIFHYKPSSYGGTPMTSWKPSHQTRPKAILPNLFWRYVDQFKPPAERSCWSSFKSNLINTASMRTNCSRSSIWVVGSVWQNSYPDC